MIFVTVGTTDFDRLIEEMDQLAPGLGDEVVCQIGKGACLPRNCEYFRFAPDLGDHLRRARLVVSHGGLGTIMEALRLGKALVGVSNPDRQDLHQHDLLDTLESRGHLLWCRDLADLGSAIARAAETSFTPYQQPRCDISLIIHRALQERAAPLGGVPRRVRS